MKSKIVKNKQYYKFCLYGFFKNLRFFDAFLLVFFLSKGISYWQIGIIYSIREITRNILEIPSGIISDILGRRTSLAAAFLLYIGSYLTFYFSNTYYVILLAMIIFAIGDAFRTGSHKAMLYSYLESHSWESHKTEYYGNTRSWSKMGSAICSLVGAWLIWESGSYASAFLFSIIPAFLDMLLILSYPKSLEGKLKEEYQKNIGAAFKESWVSMLKQIKQISLWYNINIVSMHTGYLSAIKDYLQPVIASIAIGIAVLSEHSQIQREALLIGIVFSIIYLISAISSRYSNNFVSLIKKPEKALLITLIAGLLCGVIGGFLISIGLTWWGILALILIFPIENLRKPIGVAKITDESNPKIYAFVLSIESQTGSLYAALLAPLIGVLADKYSPGFGIAICSAMLVILSAILYITKRVQRHR